MPRSAWILPVLLAGLAGCSDMARLPDAATVGPQPQLPAPAKALIPTVHIAPAAGWPAGGQPQAPAGFRVTALARGLDHPRWLYVLPNGDVLVAQSNAPKPPPGQEPKGIKAFVMKIVMKRAGAGVPSPDRIVLLRDADGDGQAEVRSTFIDGLHSPFGMALVGNDLYVANTDAIVRFAWQPGLTQISAPPVKVADLPPGGYHWTKGLVASPDGRRLYASVGSDSNYGDKGIEREQGRAAIYEIDLATGSKRLFAGGMRNPVGLAFEPRTRALWAVVNERDELGSDLVPDYLTSVREGAFYGWPWSYWGAHVDDRVKPQRPDMVARAVAPDYALGNHVAPLGLAFADGRLPAPHAEGAFVAEHGSWNRQPRSGYEVVFIPFANGRPAGPPQDFLSGFLSPDGHAWGRPVGLAFDRSGALLVADDVGNTVWRVTPLR